MYKSSARNPIVWLILYFLILLIPIFVAVAAQMDCKLGIECNLIKLTTNLHDGPGLDFYLSPLTSLLSFLIGIYLIKQGVMSKSMVNLFYVLLGISGIIVFAASPFAVLWVMDHFHLSL